MSDAEKMIENLNKNIEHRNTAGRRSLSRGISASAEFKTLLDDELKAKNRDSVPLDGDFFDEIQKEHSESCKTLYRRDTLVNATFDDFELISIIGRGTFGKVFLVEQEGTGKLYAMKCIRKDIIIENEQMENI